MGGLYSFPVWFLFYSLGLETIFALVTLSVAIYAFKIHKLSCQRETSLLAVGFLSISFSYLMWLTLSFLSFLELSDGAKMVHIQNATILTAFGVYIHVIFFLFGLATLAYMTFRIKDSRLYLMILGISIIPVLFSENLGTSFYLAASVLVLVITFFYLSEYKKKKTGNLFLTLLAFLFLFIGTFDFVFISQSYYHYVIGHIAILISYLLILVNLIDVFKDGKKTK